MGLWIVRVAWFSEYCWGWWMPWSSVFPDLANHFAEQSLVDEADHGNQLIKRISKLFMFTVLHHHGQLYTERFINKNKASKRHQLTKTVPSVNGSVSKRGHCMLIIHGDLVRREVCWPKPVLERIVLFFLTRNNCYMFHYIVFRHSAVVCKQHF